MFRFTPETRQALYAFAVSLIVVGFAAGAAVSLAHRVIPAAL